MSRSHANPLGTQDQQGNLNGRSTRDALTDEVEALRLTNQRLLRDLEELTRQMQRQQEERHPARAHPREGNGERTSPSLHGCVGTTNGVPVHGRGTTLPSPNEVQNAPNRNVQRNEKSCRPPQYLQESDGATRVPGPRQMQSFRHHTKRPDFSLVQKTPPSSISSFKELSIAFVSHFIGARTYRKPSYPLLTIKQGPRENLGPTSRGLMRSL